MLLFNDLEMYRLFHARNIDLGHAGDDVNWEELADIVEGYKTFGAGQSANNSTAARFKLLCERNCFNRKVNFSNLGLGMAFAKELACILSVNPFIA